MNDIKERVLREFLGFKRLGPAGDLSVIIYKRGEYDYFRTDEPDAEWIAAISEKFAKMGRCVYPRYVAERSDNSWCCFEIDRYGEIKKISEGPTPFEAWLMAALSQCKEVED